MERKERQNIEPHTGRCGPTVPFFHSEEHSPEILGQPSSDIVLLIRQENLILISGFTFFD